MTDASSSAGADESTSSANGGTDAFDDRPERPPSARLADALGVVDHAKRGLAVGLVLAVAVFAFFVAIPALDPGTPTRPESPVLYLALAFVVAASGTLLVASALAVRAVAGRVMDYAKWTRRAAVVGAIGGLWWALTGALAFYIGSSFAVPKSLESAVLAMLPIPVLLLAVGAWSALARTGGGRPLDADERQATDEFDHVLARPLLASAGAVLVLAGVAALHVATFLETGAFFGETTPGLVSFLSVGTLALAVGSAALTFALDQVLDDHVQVAIAAALVSISALYPIFAAFDQSAVAFAATVLSGLAWFVIGIAVRQHPGTYPERPV